MAQMEVVGEFVTSSGKKARIKIDRDNLSKVRKNDLPSALGLMVAGFTREPSRQDLDEVKLHVSRCLAGQGRLPEQLVA